MSTVFSSFGRMAKHNGLKFMPKTRCRASYFATVAANIPSKMKAAAISTEPRHVLNVQDGVTVPKLPTDKHLLIRVKYTAINRADLMQKKGLYPPPPGASDILGLECAGEVVSVGSGVTRHRVGDRVMALLTGGGYAEYCAAHEGSCIGIPSSMSWENAAAIPEVFLTAYQCLFWHGNLSKDKNVLIHAGASAVGLAACQLCSVAKCKHIITTSSANKTKACLENGATHALSKARTGPKERSSIFAWDIKQIVGEKGGMDVIMDPVFGEYLAENVDVLATDGTIVVYAFMGGNKIGPEVSVPTLFRKRACLKFSTLRSQNDAYKQKLVDDFWAFAAPHFASGALRPNIECVVPMTDVNKAHELLEKNATQGKVLLAIS